MDTYQKMDTPPLCTHHYRTGLIHINDGNVGAEVSADLKNLKMSIVCAELPDGQSELHGVVHLAMAAAQ